jgi:DNA-binding response OmpR family regulator
MDNRPRNVADDASPGENRAKRQPVVLLVDDHDEVRKMLGLYLGWKGFEVELAASGREAIELYQQREKEIRVVVLDVDMPGMDGVETLMALRACDPAVRCCFLSGGHARYTAQDLLEAGAAAILIKPSQLAELAGMVRVLAETPVEQSHPRIDDFDLPSHPPGCDGEASRGVPDDGR